MPPTTASDPASAALATSAPVGTNAPIPVAAAATTTPTSLPAVATTPPTYDNNVSSGSALQDLTNFQTSQKSPVDAYNEAVTQLGIPDVRTNVTGLRKQIADTTALLNALPDSVTGRTSGSLVTEAQRGRILGMERAPLDQANAQYTGAYNASSANLADLTGQAQNQANLVQQGQTNISNALQTRYSGIKSAEDTKAAKEAADRQYQVTMQQIADQNRQFEAQMAQTRASMAQSNSQFNATMAASKSAANAPSTLQSASSDAGNLLRNIMVRPSGYTESAVIPQISAAYPELTRDQVNKLVWDQRKSMYGF